jgi:hypothetical protein
MCSERQSTVFNPGLTSVAMQHYHCSVALSQYRSAPPVAFAFVVLQHECCGTGLLLDLP